MKQIPQTTFQMCEGRKYIEGFWLSLLLGDTGQVLSKGTGGETGTYPLLSLSSVSQVIGSPAPRSWDILELFCSPLFS